jgi:hypothetical protein
MLRTVLSQLYVRIHIFDRCDHERKCEVISVTKEEFKGVYFRLGGSSGWTADYWQEFFEVQVEPGWRFLVEEPRSPEHDRMWIVSDQGAKEHRLFFSTDQDTEDFFDYPGKE